VLHKLNSAVTPIQRTTMEGSLTAICITSDTMGGNGIGRSTLLKASESGKSSGCPGIRFPRLTLAERFALPCPFRRNTASSLRHKLRAMDSRPTALIVFSVIFLHCELPWISSVDTGIRYPKRPSVP
jgi:hypothetical protein